jgi:hypothetical protein
LKPTGLALYEGASLHGSPVGGEATSPVHAALWVVLLTALGGAPQDEAVLALGRRLSADFWAGHLEPVWAQMDERVQTALGGSPEGLSRAREQILDRFGGPGETLGERVADVRGVQVYLRTFRGKTEQPLLEQWAIQDGKAVAGFFVRPTELPVETLKRPPPSPATYGLVAGLLAGTALSMAGLSYWLRRRKTAG